MNPNSKAAKFMEALANRPIIEYTVQDGYYTYTSRVNDRGKLELSMRGPYRTECIDFPVEFVDLIYKFIEENFK